MTKYTLDETWELCLQMWKWIAGQIKANPALDVADLKGEWTKEHNFVDIDCNCFFCQYDTGKNEEWEEDECLQCPGRLVDPEFNCTNSEYHYFRLPIEFSEQLLELDKKRKEQK